MSGIVNECCPGIQFLVSVHLVLGIQNKLSDCQFASHSMLNEISALLSNELLNANKIDYY